MNKAFQEDLDELLHINEQLYQDYLKLGSGRICEICKQTDVQSEPISFHCCGNCNRTISRYMRYFVNPNMTFICCSSCYLKLPDEIHYEQLTINKADLRVRHLDETSYESVNDLYMNEL